jgi:hypothetical protein
VREDDLVGGVVGLAAELDGGVGDKRAAEVVGGEPVLERVPQRIEAPLRVVAGPVDAVVDRVEPVRAPLLERGRDERSLPPNCR